MHGRHIAKIERASLRGNNTIKRSGAAFTLLAGLAPVILSATAAEAQDRPRFSISPRFYVVSVTGPDQNKPLSMALGGLSASYSIAPQWDITATGLYGSGDTESFDGTRKNESTRRDLELVARYRIPESPAYLVGGYRQINIKDEATQFGVLASESNVTIRAAQFGGGFASRLSKNGRHAAFANLVMAGGSFEREEFKFSPSETVTADGCVGLIDTNVGYQYAFNGWLAASARYRVIAVRIWASGVESEAFLHGPEVALTFRF